MSAISDPSARLKTIAALISPCPPPDIAGGYDLCPCGRGSTWPCPTTRVAWLAAGLDPTEEARAVCARAMADAAWEVTR